eukprot:CAMPEP_0171090592 /NCGR_PEP_ID=MMETSP0766_2-20121228/31955_1 /TAXON_ID=439317 /ORGANISM="Gambierdiscus australes, Strain CAWD 149" /LENGTH=55 /DNA_ID=CAMNT_0011548605 /DNA_START=48 /DNA_END=212 /DNA_ORIENTATION=+
MPSSPRRPASALPVGLILLCLRSTSFSFIGGLRAPISQRGDQLVARVSAEYLERL